ncbi:NADH dehydrogenase [ubiquinone] 1 alpha subcomplex assembly factor 3 [Topomyia yanbarensis]|uniref:NADH dehydrogenase [ubiquinone] 1 alpha subcomplex assembly factor 3 n=1 Tax=Topomyia yanbarensis TaxID=2498891 RepID=UPI00273AE0FC|nr:NADH dehydrogenase [ubiquinone] 1 alpha subcomplex assembly factor 3 [Topomyia yanbarensis]
MQSVRRLQSFLRPPAARSLYSSIVHRSSAYDGDGKTTLSILNLEAESGLLINSYSQVGFRLNNNMVVLGPMAIFPRTVFSWNVASYEDINEESLSLFSVLEPKIDILVVGIGDQPMTPALNKRIIEYMRKYRINVEVLSTEQACATFNFLNSEGRVVAGALIPPVSLRVNEDDVMRTQVAKRQVYELEEN